MDGRSRAIPEHSLRVAAVQMQSLAGDKDVHGGLHVGEAVGAVAPRVRVGVVVDRNLGVGPEGLLHGHRVSSARDEQRKGDKDLNRMLNKFTETLTG